MDEGKNKYWREAHPEQDVDQPDLGKQPSTAENASFETGAGAPVPGFDAPIDETIGLSNPEIAKQAEDAHLKPYYPPGGAPDGGVSDDKEA